jgi:hypothetical protein
MVRPIAVTALLSFVVASAICSSLRAEAAPDIASLVGQLRDSDAIVRLKTAKALGGLGAKAADALPALQKMASDDSDEDVRSVAENAVEKIARAAHAPKLSGAVEQLVKAARAGPPTARQKAIDDLGAMGDKARDAGSVLVELVMDKSPAIQRSAADALEKVDPDIWRPVVESVLQHNPTACARVGALGTKGTNALPALLKFYKEALDRVSKRQDIEDSNVGQFLAAAVAVAPADERVVSMVRNILTTKKPSGTERALLPTALDMISPPRTESGDIIGTDRKNEFHSLSGDVRLQMEKKEAVRLLISVASVPLDKPSAFDSRTKAALKCRLQAIRALGEYGPDARDALDLLKSLKYTPGVMDEAQRAIKTIEGR